MARQEVNIGVEGNDGTGDSIRESFRKTNENFSELYAVFGQGGTIRFTSLEDTPSELIPNTVALVNDAGTAVQLATLASNSALDENASDTITFNFSQTGKLIISTAFTQLADDQTPAFSGALYGGGTNGIGGVAITEAAAQRFQADHGVALTIDDLVITKGYADRRYITSANVGLPIRVEEEPTTVTQYTLNINRYVSNNVEVLNHGFDSGVNGTAYRFFAEDTDPTNIASNDIVYLRYVDENNFTLHTSEAGAAAEDSDQANATKILVAGTIDPNDVHTLTDAAYDTNLPGNFLDNVAIPRKSAVRRQGDVLEGALLLHDHPGELAGEGAPNGDEDLQAATKYYVDNTSYSSPTNLFVSTKGDDSMAGVPSGKEGTSLTYAYKTINAAAKRAYELVKTAEAEPGPYFQTVTKENGSAFAPVVTAGISSPVYTNTRTQILDNRQFIIQEVSGFLAYTYPDFVYDIATCERDTGLILDAIAFDINRGLNANYLTRQAAEKYYSNSSGRKAITSQLTETRAGFVFAKELVTAILQNDFYQEKVIDDITRASPGVVTTTTNHGLADKNIVTFKNIGGMTQIEGEKLYVKVVSDQVFELYEDSAFEIPFDTSGFDGYTSGGRLGLIYQTDEAQVFAGVDGDPAARNAVRAKFELLDTIITNGIDSGADIVYGATYQVVLDNGSASNVDQGDPDNTDILPGKTMVGEISGAKGQIVSLTVNDGTNGNNDTVQLQQLNAVDFIEGEPVRYGNFVKKKQVTIFVESGFYEEDYPIRLANNVSLKGDEFRRVIIRPKDRVSQSPFAETYFFRDKEFDDLTVAKEGEPFRNQINEIQGYFGYHYLSRPSLPKNIGSPIVNAGGATNAAKILRENKKFIQEEVIEFIANNQPNLTYDETKCRRDTGLVIEAAALDMALGTNYNAVTAGLSYQRAGATYLQQNQKDATISAFRYLTILVDELALDETAKIRFRNAILEVIDIIDDGVVSTDAAADTLVFPAPTNATQAVQDGVQQLIDNRSFLQAETIAYITANYPALVYDDTKCERDVGYIVDGLCHDLMYGGDSATQLVAKSYFENAASQLGAGQQAATVAAYQNLATIASQVVQGLDVSELQGVVTQAGIGSSSGGAGEGTTVDGLVQLIEDVINAGNITGLPAVTMPSLTWTEATLQTAYTSIVTTNQTSLTNDVITFINDNFLNANFDYNEEKCKRDVGLIVDAVATDLVAGGEESTLEAQGDYYYYYISKYATDPGGFLGQEAITRDSISYISTIASRLFTGVYASGDILQNTGAADYVAPDLTFGTGESAATSAVGNLIDKIVFAFDVDYNPPLRNNQMDVFLMSDATIVRNVTVQGHGGFMCVLDPEGQVLTKSPYIQTASSFSESINRKRFAGGMYVDAFVGNIPAYIPETIDPTGGGAVSGKVDNFTLWIRSTPGQGLFIRPPELPCPFYVEGRRYQVNAISDYDSGNGWCKIYLDAGSNNGDGYDETQFADGLYYRTLFLQTAGNRSMLANDFTQINDLGYGLVVNNGAFSEQVSTFTYYCHAAFYANNGSEIRSLNGSNGYGNFGLVAEGADPNEIPDQVVLRDNMVQPCKAFTTATYTNAFDEPSVYITDLKDPPLASSQITIDHGGAIGVLNYVIQTVTTISDNDNDGIYGENGDVIVSGIEAVQIQPAADAARSAGTYDDVIPNGGTGTDATFTVVIAAGGGTTVTPKVPGAGYTQGDTITIPASRIGGSGSDVTFSVDVFGGTLGAGTFNNIVYKLDLRADDVRADDYFGTLQDTVPNGTLIEYRNDFNHIFDDVIDQTKLVTRPSTAINFDESDDTTYRSVAFAAADGLSQPLAATEVATTFEVGFDFVEIEVDSSNTGGGYGSAQGDTQLAIVALNPTDAARATRDVAGLQPGDGGYAGGMIFSHAGKVHQITDYDDSGAFVFITFSDVASTNISAYGGSGLATGISDSRVLFAGLPANATAEITIAISLTRATGHDFTQIGTGSYNDTNYPNVILGDPENSLAEFYTDSPDASSGQVWERRKGRVFFVSTDQYGFFRVGKFFSVDQATGDITFAGEIGLSNANSLGFKRGVTINEFSADDSMVDESGTAVPTEKAIVSYFNRRLGYGGSGQILAAPAGNRIGPGVVMLNGASEMEGDLQMGANQITNVGLPGTDGTAATNKNYVDGRVREYDQFDDLREVEINNLASADLIVGTGKKRAIMDFNATNFSAGDTISTGSPGVDATVVDVETIEDRILGDVTNTYQVAVVTFDGEIGGTLAEGDNVSNGVDTAEILEEPVGEIANASEDAGSDINVTVTRTASGATYDFQYGAGSLENADVSASAAIAQSKLAMNASTTRANATGIAQSDLGLASFKDTEFNITDGWVELADSTNVSSGIAPSKLQHMATDTVLGRSAAGDGAVSAIPFSDVLAEGGAITDGDLPAYSGTNNQAVVRTAAATYTATDISTGSSANTIAKRDNNGKLQAASYIIGGDATYEILSATGTELEFKTPGQAVIMTAQGNNSAELVTEFPGSIDVGSTTITTESTFQTNASTYAGEGFVATDWIYTKFIEAIDERDANSTGIGLGADTGFTGANADTIQLIANGDVRLQVNGTTTTVKDALDVDGATTLKGNITLGDAATDLISVNGRFNTSLLPSSDLGINIGQGGGTPLRIGTVHANLFSGTATTARYADLAEKYVADANYEPGTVVVFGGDNEVTVCTSKGQTSVAGVISTNPAYLMNSELDDPTAVDVALMGRVPCKVIGKVEIGDMLVTSAVPGYAMVNNSPGIGQVLGKAITNKQDGDRGIIEIAVGKV